MEEKREQGKNSEQLYIEYHGNTPVHYAYGEPWVAQALFMGDIKFSTEQEAREAWEKWKNGGEETFGC